MPACITYFFVKNQRKPTTGWRTPPRLIPQLTPVIPDPDQEINWGIVESRGILDERLGVRKVQRLGIGDYMVDLTAPRVDKGWVVSRFANGDRPMVPNVGPYSLLDEREEDRFMIKWYDRDGNPIDIDFVFGLYG